MVGGRFLRCDRLGLTRKTNFRACGGGGTQRVRESFPGVSWERYPQKRLQRSRRHEVVPHDDRRSKCRLSSGEGSQPWMARRNRGVSEVHVENQL
jgi:hypothetical protein